MKKLIVIISLIFASTPAIASGKLKIAVSINPIYQILLSIVAEKADVDLIMNPKASEHHHQLKRKDAKSIYEADLIFYVDNNLESNFAKLAKGKNTSRQLSQIKGIKILNKRGNKRQRDLHIWLNPDNAVKIAEFMTKEVSDSDAANSKTYYQNLFQFKKELSATKEKISNNISNSSSKHIFLTQDYQYFEDYFDFKPLKVISAGHDRNLKIQDIRELEGIIKDNKVECIFGDLYDEKNSAQKLARNYGVKYGALDLIGSDAGYLKILIGISDEISSCD